MSVEDLLQAVGEIKDKANVKAVFGESQVVGDKTVIPVAQVWYGFGMGFGQGPTPSGEEVAGGGGGARVRPLAVLEITPAETNVVPVLDMTRIVLYSIVAATWNLSLIVKAVLALTMRGKKEAE
jgi:uncharacterized spore protein YtfJ